VRTRVRRSPSTTGTRIDRLAPVPVRVQRARGRRPDERDAALRLPRLISAVCGDAARRSAQPGGASSPRCRRLRAYCWRVMTPHIVRSRVTRRLHGGLAKGTAAPPATHTGRDGARSDSRPFDRDYASSNAPRTRQTAARRPGCHAGTTRRVTHAPAHGPLSWHRIRYQRPSERPRRAMIIDRETLPRPHLKSPPTRCSPRRSTWPSCRTATRLPTSTGRERSTSYG
jgi:hypothetical protein